MVKPKLLAQQLFHRWVDIILQLQQNNPPTAPPLDRSPEIADQILGIVFDF
jgi:hypothetical protein